MIVSIFHDLSGQSNVILEGFGRGVDHNGSKAAVDAGFAQFKSITVIQMKSNGKTGLFNCGFHQFHQIGMICIIACALGNLKNQRSIKIFRCLGNSLDDFHIIYIKCTNSISTVIGFFEHFSCCY